MRPWVLLKALNVPFEESLHLFKPQVRQSDFIAFSPTAKVPCLHTDDGLVIWDSLAICEYVAESHPQAWPTDAAARAWARSASAEMHSGFAATRDECSMNVALRVELGTPSDGLKKDIARFNQLFTEGLAKFGGPWLAGREFTIVDAMYAPVAVRFQGYGIKLEGAANEYVDRLLLHPAVQSWIQDGLVEKAREPFHEEGTLRGRKLLQDLSKET